MGLDNPLHIAFLLFVVLVIFGAKRLPEMGRSLGSGMRGFRDALSGTEAQHALAAPVAATAAVGATAAASPATAAEPVAAVSHPAVHAATAALPPAA
jgi:sec-independent protein translocase protein TatA